MTISRTAFRGRAPMFAVLLLIGILGGLAVWWLPVSAPDPAPTVRFVMLDGHTPTLAEFRGRPVLVGFWATSCAPCVEELPDLIRLYEDWHPGGFELIAVAMPYDPPIDVRSFVASHAVPYPVALDLDAKVARAFDGVPYIPAAFLIDPEGHVVYRQTGKLDIARVQRIMRGFADRTGAKP